MATRTAKLKIELDGEKQYKAAIAEINRENKTLGEQMKKLSAEYKGNENSVEALSKKQELLNKSLLENQAKVAETRKQLAAWREAQERVKESLGASSEEYKTTQKKIQEYEAALAKAETAEIETQHAIDDTTKALENNGKQMVSLGDAVDQVAGKLGIKIPDGAKKALAGMEGFSAGSVAAMAGVAAAVAAVVKVVKELNDLTLEAASRADDLMTQSITSGISTDLLQAYQYAAPYIDVSADAIVNANKKIGASIVNAAEQYAAYDQAVAKAAAQGKEYEGSLGAQAEAFQRLGVSVTDSTGQLRPAHEVMLEVFGTLQQITNETERNGVAMDLLGKSYDEFIPIVENVTKMEELKNEAMESGYVLTEQQLEILGEVDDAHEKYTQTIEKNKNLIATQWAPASKEAYEALASLMDKAGKALIDSGLVSNFAALVQSTIGLFESGSQLFDAMPSWLNPINIVSNALKGLAVIMATIADYADAVRGVMTLDFNKVGTALGLNASKGQLSNRQKLKYGNDWTYYEGSGWTTKNSSAAGYDSARGLYYDKNGNYIFPGSNAAGTSDWRGGLTWVGEAGPELVRLPQHAQILSNQESRALAGGDQHIVINVQGIEQLDQVVRWYTSMQTRERMR